MNFIGFSEILLFISALEMSGGINSTTTTNAIGEKIIHGRLVEHRVQRSE